MVTLRNRKVKCDEQRPRCSHCERLNLECKWRPISSRRPSERSGTARQRQVDHSTATRVVASTILNDTHPASDFQAASVAPQLHSPLAQPTPAGLVVSPEQLTPHITTIQPTCNYIVDDVFDYASFLWTPGGTGDFWPHEHVSHDFDQASLSNWSQTRPIAGAQHGSDHGVTSPAQDFPITSGLVGIEQQLMDFFAQSTTPPILSEVETRKEWLAMRNVVLRMAHASTMVRCAILCFSNLSLSRQQGDSGLNKIQYDQKYYEAAIAQEADIDLEMPFKDHSPLREHLLVALFFLSYVDILESRLAAAQSHLKSAYGIFRQAQHDRLTSTESQFLLWIRLLDGRAVTAGGEGLFLSEEDDQLFTVLQTSPSSLTEGNSSPTNASLTAENDEIEDVLFQVLYHPGIVFYQKVQNFAGRIAKIDPWHRSRGTVEDETEVMNIGAAIAADLRILYAERPPLMNIAVAGRLTQPHVSANLAFVITRAFRTYLSNYYACKVYLHRVAYKNLPLTKEAGDALAQIRRLGRLLLSDLDADEDSLPVNMLWPLLMLGVEEKDLEEKAWINTQILRMERVAGNAKITAQVLEEVQARQDAGNERVDIRSVMHAVFDSCFAIL